MTKPTINAAMMAIRTAAPAADWPLFVRNIYENQMIVIFKVSENRTIFSETLEIFDFQCIVGMTNNLFYRICDLFQFRIRKNAPPMVTGIFPFFFRISVEISFSNYWFSRF